MPFRTRKNNFEKQHSEDYTCDVDNVTEICLVK